MDLFITFVVVTQKYSPTDGLCYKIVSSRVINSTRIFFVSQNHVNRAVWNECRKKNMKVEKR